jgi:hypothetical protein
MGLSPQQREQLHGFLAEMHELSRFERHFRRTDRLWVLSVAITAVFVVAVANVSEGFMRGLAVGLLFPLGTMFGATLVNARNRRRSFGQIAALGEIAELTLLYHEDDDA